jgi:predicted NAD/FAD-dependent oxidoreductase
VLVVGGGPAGLEAARVSAERGHTVTLIEAADGLGGQWRLAGKQPSRYQVLDHIAWYGRELERLGVEIRRGEHADVAAVAAARADHVIVAVGSSPPTAGFQRALRLSDELPGLDRGRAATAHAVLAAEVEVSGRVLVLDDVNDWRGIGTAMFLQERGCSVTIATAAPAVADALYHSAADVPARRRFALAGGALSPNTVLAEWRGDSAVMRSTLTRAETVQPFDWLVIAGTAVARTALAHDLRVAGIAHVTVGDCLSPRTAAAAILDGRRTALAI